MISYNNSAPKAVNNVGQFGATEGSIGAYKTAAEYAADAKYWALLSQTKYSSVEEILAEVERLYTQGLLFEEDIKQLKTDFEDQNQTLLGLIQDTVSAVDNTNAATELSKEATQQVLDQLDIISNMTVQVSLLPPGSLATGSYDNETGQFSFGIPEGAPGRDGTDGTISDIGSVAIGTPDSGDYGFYVDQVDGGLYRTSMVDIANLIPSVRSVKINGGLEQTGEVTFNSVSSFNTRTGDVVPKSGDYSVEQILGAAKSGANSDITSLTGLTTALSVTQGGTGATNADDARINLGFTNAGIGGSVIPIQSSLDWQTFEFMSGGTYVVAVSSMTNTPAALAAIFSTSNSTLFIDVLGTRGPSSLNSVRVSSSTSNNAVFRVVEMTFQGTQGSRTFHVRELYSSGTNSIVPVSNGGTGATSAENARLSLVAAKRGDNYDITSLHGLTSALSIDQGGTGATSASMARDNLGLSAALPVSMSEGGSVVSRTQRVIFTNGGYVGEYLWNGSVPKLLEAGSNPWSTGGFSSSGWVKISGRMMFEDFGAVGDGITDDTASIARARDWFCSGVNGQYLTTGSDKIYLISSMVDFNFSNKSGFTLEMVSPVRPSNTASIGFKFQNVRDSSFDLKVNGGGHVDDTYFNKSHANYVDYTVASPVGGLTAFLVRGSRNCNVNVVGVNYKGRVFSTLGIDTSTSGRIKQSFMTLNIKTGDATSVSNGRCGQGMYLRADDSAYGKVETAFINWDFFGSVIEDVADIAIGHIEFGANGNSGFEFRGIATANIDTLSGGDETKTNTVLSFLTSSSGQECIGVNIQRIFALQGANGVQFNGSNGAASGTRQNFTVGSIYSQGHSRSGVVINGCNNSTFSNLHLQSNGYGIEFQRVNRNVVVNSANSLSSIYNSIINIGSANNSSIFFNNCRFIGNSGAGCIDMSLGTTNSVTFRDCLYSSQAGVISLPATSNVRMLGGEIMDFSPLYFSTGSSSSVTTIKDVIGYKTHAIGSSSIGSGNQSVSVQHGLSQTPKFVSIMPQSNDKTFRVISVTNTSFTVNLNAVVTDVYNFQWMATSE